MQRTLLKSFSPDLRRKIRKDDDTKMKNKKNRVNKKKAKNHV